MKTKEIFNKVGTILTEVNEQYEYLAKSAEDLNDLELELLSANADFLAEHIKVLMKLNAAAKPSNPVAVDQDIQDNDGVPQISDQQITSAAEPFVLEESDIKPQFTESYFSFEDNSQKAEDVKEQTESVESEYWEQNDAEPELEDYEVIESENLPDSAIATIEPEIIIPEVEPEEHHEADEPEEAISFNKVLQEAEVISSSTPEKAPTLNEIIAAQRSQSAGSSRNSITGRLNRQPETDLKTMINLNDKLLFIKDLFNGYSLAYSEAIEILNRFDSFDAADNFLKTNYAAKNNWASKQATADKFYELLNRRFSK